MICFIMCVAVPMVRFSPAAIPVWITVQMDSVQSTVAHFCPSAGELWHPNDHLNVFPSHTCIHCLTVAHCVSRCPLGWKGYRCEVTATPVDSSPSSGSKSHISSQTVVRKLRLWFCDKVIGSVAGTTSIVIPVLLLLVLAMLVVGAIWWYKRRMRGWVLSLEASFSSLKLHFSSVPHTFSTKLLFLSYL